MGMDNDTDMSMQLKYVIVKRDGEDTEVPILFAEILDHRSVVPYDARVVSAGFVEIQAVKDTSYHELPTTRVFCYGKSMSLHLESRMDVDEAIINEFLGG
jgi:hypothetical protein